MPHAELAAIDQLPSALADRRLRELFRRIPKISVQGYDAQRRVVFWNEASEALYGYTEAEALGRRLEELIIPPVMVNAVVQAHADWLDKGIEIPAGELVLRHKNGAPVPVFSSHLLQRNVEGGLEMYCVDIDLQEQKQARARLELAQSVFESAREGVAVLDASGRVLEVNPALCTGVGLTREQLLGQHVSRWLECEASDGFSQHWHLLKERGHWSGECRYRQPDGRTAPVLATLSALRDEAGQLGRVVALFADIAEQKAHETELRYLATHDSLTGLPNRSLLRDRLGQALALGRRERTDVAVIYIDLDHFKEVNDTLGHAGGDQMLCHVAGRMLVALREVDTLARLGGDEFVAVLVGLMGRDSLGLALERLRQAVSTPLVLEGRTWSMQASMGVALASAEEALDADGLLRQADLAMYQAKLAGKSRVAYFDTDLDRRVRQRHRRTARALQALRSGELCLYYQPQVDLASGRVVGAEALVRWQHPKRGLISPAEFLPYLEDGEPCFELGEWVMRTALLQQRSWVEAGLPLKVSVNISGAHLQHPDFVGKLQRLMDEGGRPEPFTFCVELLESTALQNLATTADTIRACQALGVSVAIDDFGTGYSSLAYLKQLPADVLKIDRSFVQHVLDDEGDRAILHGILHMGKAFQRGLVAEGVESLAQAQALREMGCDQAQGYAISRPMPAHALLPWVHAYSPI